MAFRDGKVGISSACFIVLLLGGIAGCERRGRIEVSQCDVNETRINDSTLGPLHIDEALPAVRVRCPAVADTAVAIATVPAGAVRLIVRGAPILALHDGNKVTALRVESPFFQTNDSLGVGTSIARFRGVRGIRVAAAPGAATAVLLDRRRCGVAYELSGWGSSPPAEGDPALSGAALAAWPDSIVVRAIVVSGCRGASRDLFVDSIAEARLDTFFADSMVPPDSLPTAESRLPPRLPPERAPVPAVAATPSTVELRGPLDVPVQGVLRSQLRDTYTESRGSRPHEAIDIPAPRGTPVLSATEGRILKLFDSKTGGLMVYATDATERFILLYGHLDRYADGVRDGMRLERGQVIGHVGTTGNAPPGTPHLHFAILRGDPKVSWSRGAAINPYPLLVSTTR